MKFFKTLKPHVYAGKRRKVGDEYEARGRSDARIITALGWAAEIPRHVEAPKAPTYYTAEIQPEETAAPRKRRAYKRRDLTAE